MRACGNPVPGQYCWLHEFYLLMLPMILVIGNIPTSINTSDRFFYNSVRLLPRGARAGATAQIRGSGRFKDDAKASGGWRSKAYEIYERNGFSVSNRFSTAMHNTAAADLEELRYFYATSRPPQL